MDHHRRGVHRCVNIIKTCGITIHPYLFLIFSHFVLVLYGRLLTS